jgi:iron complex outermembrane recepter protein
VANSWTRYNLIQDEDRVLGVGLGYVMAGDRRGAYNAPLKLDGYSRWDLGFFGRLNAWEMNTYVENIFNVRYETGSIDQYQIYPGAPTNFRFQLGVVY